MCPKLYKHFWHMFRPIMRNSLNWQGLWWAARLKPDGAIEPVTEQNKEAVFLAADACHNAFIWLVVWNIFYFPIY